jgi:hypothetical protein
MPQIFDSIELKLLDGLHAVLPAATASAFCVGLLNLRGCVSQRCGVTMSGIPTRMRDLIDSLNCCYFSGSFLGREIEPQISHAH